MHEKKYSGVEWIGEIPERWSLQRGKTIFSQRMTKGNEACVLLAATQKQGMIPQSMVEGVVQVKEDADLQQFRTVHKSDFVISLRSFQGGFEFSEYEGVCSPAYQVFYNTAPICHDHFRMLFKSDGFIQKMNSLTVGIREGKNIQYADFADSLIPIPPLDVQKKIAEYLNARCAKIDALIAKQQEIIEKLKAYKLSVITEAVTKGLNPNVPMKDSGYDFIGDIPQSWIQTKLKHITLAIGDGIHTTPDYDAEGDYFFLNGNSIGQDRLVFKESTDRLNEVEFRKYKSPLLTDNTVLITLNGATYGKTSFYHGEKVLLGKSAGYITLKPDVNKQYVRYYLQSKAAKIIMELSLCGSTIANLSLGTLKNFFVPLPSIEEQKKIVNYLNQECNRIDSIICSREQMINKLVEYKRSLIYEVVTGKREV